MNEKQPSQATSQQAEPTAVSDASYLRNFPVSVTTSPQPFLLEVAPSSALTELIELGVELARFEPEILEFIAADLKEHGLKKKQQRNDHQRFLDGQTETLVEVSSREPDKRSLAIGRPRMSPLAVLVFLLLRGWLGGCKELRFRVAVKESISLRIFLENIGASLPSASTLNENLNALSNETRRRIHCAELALVLDEKLDDFSMLRIDSTDARSASAYPTDSGTITKLMCRMCTRLGQLERLGLKECSSSELSVWQGEIRKLNYQISTLTSSSAKQAERNAREEEAAQEPKPLEKKDNPEKKESSKQRLRRELYEQLYVLVEERLPEIEALFLQAKGEVTQQQCSPRQRHHQEQFVEEFTQDLELVRRGVEQSRRRVCEGKKPSVKAGMPLSVSDPEATFIEKGSWDRTFGFRPQLGFSASNLVTAIIVPEGNASDQSQLTAVIEQSIANTTVVPSVVSVDDGYTGADQLAQSLALGVEIVSFSGVHGKRLLGEEKWESEPYVAARKARNGAESGIYVLKKKVGFEQLAATGQERVRGEQLEKVLACNAFKIADLRRRRKEERKRSASSTAQNKEVA